eukprot:2404082-Pyramimonas_sp.AAC.1
MPSCFLALASEAGQADSIRLRSWAAGTLRFILAGRLQRGRIGLQVARSYWADSLDSKMWWISSLRPSLFKAELERCG